LPQGISTVAGFAQGVSSEGGLPQYVSTAGEFPQGVSYAEGFPKGVSTATRLPQRVSSTMGPPHGGITTTPHGGSHSAPNQAVTSTATSQKGHEGSYTNGTIDASSTVLQDTSHPHHLSQTGYVMAAYSAADKAVQTLPASETAIQRALQAQTDTLRRELDDAKVC